MTPLPIPPNIDLLMVSHIWLFGKFNTNTLDLNPFELPCVVFKNVHCVINPYDSEHHGFSVSRFKDHKQMLSIYVGTLGNTFTVQIVKFVDRATQYPIHKRSQNWGHIW